MTADNENGHCNRVVSKSKPNPSPEMTNSTIDDKCPSSYRMEIVWRNIFLMIILHVASVYGGYLGIFHARYRTVMFNYLYLILTGLGITAGAHRLWAHRSYEATTTLRIILMLFNCGALQNDILEWSRDHRVHHKFSETDADPHNSRRGFFFAHIGWLLCRKHPEVKNKGRTVSLKDIADDTGLDISTISRVSNSKSVQTDYGVYPIKYFFGDGMISSNGEEVSTRAIKQKLSELITQEDKQKPLTDEELASKLSEEGYSLARRTIAKFREALGIPIARLRRNI